MRLVIWSGTAIVSFLAGRSEGELGLHCCSRQEPLTSAYKVLPGHQREVSENPTYSKPLQGPSVCWSHHSKSRGVRHNPSDPALLSSGEGSEDMDYSALVC